MTATREFEAIPALKPGDAIRVVAPAGPFDPEAFDRGIAKLNERYDIRVGPGIHSREGFLAGSDEHRLSCLIAALEERDTKAILCARGGYGSMRIVSRVPRGMVRRAKKLLIGFSDITTLHALWALAGLRSLHASMAAGLGRASLHAVSRFQAALEGRSLDTTHRVEAIVPGRAEGPLLGGNLAILASLVGTPFFPPVDGCVLFLEDVGERPYRVDRMLTQLDLAGVFRRVSAVALGTFTECAPSLDGVTVDEVLVDRLEKLKVPTVRGLAAGHIDDPVELALGARVVVDTRGGTLTFVEGTSG